MRLSNPHQFVIRWRRLGEWYTFEQTVFAGSMKEARRIAAAEVKDALQDNYQEWTISEIEKVQSTFSFRRAREADALS